MVEGFPLSIRPVFATLWRQQLPVELWGWQHRVALIFKKVISLWSHGISNLAETRALHTSFFPWMCVLLLPICFPASVSPEGMEPLAPQSCVQKFHAEWCLFYVGTTNVDPQGSSSRLEPVFVQTLISGSTDCGLMSIPQHYLPTCAQSKIHSQFSTVHPFQTEKCAQSCVSTLKIWTHSCSCFKLPTGPWINCFISASVLHPKGKLAYS